MPPRHNLPPRAHTVHFPGLTDPKVVMARTWSSALVEAAGRLTPSEKAAFIAAREALLPCDQLRWRSQLGF